MGWASGSQLAGDLYRRIRSSISVDKRQAVAEAFIDEFEGHDADDWDENHILWKDSGRPSWIEEIE